MTKCLVFAISYHLWFYKYKISSCIIFLQTKRLFLALLTTQSAWDEFCTLFISNVFSLSTGLKDGLLDKDLKKKKRFFFFQQLKYVLPFSADLFFLSGIWLVSCYYSLCIISLFCSYSLKTFFFFPAPCGFWIPDLSSLTRDWTQALGNESSMS